LIRLHYYPGNASLAPHMLLEELGVPYELVLVDRASSAHRSESYLQLNPNGLIPTLEHDGLVLWETVAILLHLADHHPAAGLAPVLGTAERSQLYKWLAHLTNTLQADYLIFFYPERYAADPADVAQAAGIKARAAARLDEAFDRIEIQLGDRPYLLGDRPGLADFMLLMLIRWGRTLARPPRDLPGLGRFAVRLLECPAVGRALAQEGLAAPFV
jgi:glutathione S-transferase